VLEYTELAFTRDNTLGMLLMKIKRDSYSPVLPLVVVLCPTCSASSCAGCSKLPKDITVFFYENKSLQMSFFRRVIALAT